MYLASWETSPTRLNLAWWWAPPSLSRMSVQIVWKLENGSKGLLSRRDAHAAATVGSITNPPDRQWWGTRRRVAGQNMVEVGMKEIGATTVYWSGFVWVMPHMAIVLILIAQLLALWLRWLEVLLVGTASCKLLFAFYHWSRIYGCKLRLGRRLHGWGTSFLKLYMVHRRLPQQPKWHQCFQESWTRMKHLDLHFYWLRDKVENGMISTLKMIADWLPYQVSASSQDLLLQRTDGCFGLILSFSIPSLSFVFHVTSDI